MFGRTFHMMTKPLANSFDPAGRRAAVRRTAWILAIVAVAVFVGFVLHVVLG
jgi:hypothetical protein